MGLLWGVAFHWVDLALFAGFYLVCAFGTTIGFHRYFTHRGFETGAAVKVVLAVLGCMTMQGPLTQWVTDHRKHHALSDKPGDPHSPHVGHGRGIGAVLRGLWHAHTGWLLVSHGRADWRRYARDLCDDRGMRLLTRWFPGFVLAGLLIPALAGFLVSGTLAGAATGLLWGGLVRVFFVHHVTWSVNSVCHFFGTRRFATDDRSTNVFWLAIPSLGGSWHHNHHAFPRSATHGLRWYEVDPSSLMIRGLARIGLAWDVVAITPERQRERLASSGT